ncbi:MAG: hypothetical protein ABIU10_10300 [Sphingomicrobium sp.]
MHLKFLITMAALLVPVAASAQSMNAEAFVTRAHKLKAKGPLAIFSGGEIKVLMNEGKASGDASRRQRLAAIKAGKKPRYCPPEGPQQMNSDEFMTRLSAIPRADRQRINMTEAMNRILTGKFPCR